MSLLVQSINLLNNRRLLTLESDFDIDIIDFLKDNSQLNQIQIRQRFARITKKSRSMNQVIQRIFCENHNKEVRYICCDLNCNQRVFCGSCLRSEIHASHSEKIFALEEFIDENQDDVWQVFQKNKRSNFLTDELSHLIEQKKRDLIEAIEREFKELQVTLRNYSESFEREKEKISDIQKVVKEYLQHQVQASDVKSSFDNFKQLFKEQINSFKEFDYPQFSWQQQQLLDSLKDLKSRFFTTYQFVDEEWLNEIKQNMEKSLIQNPESSSFYQTFSREIEQKNIQKYQNLQNQNNNFVLITSHFTNQQNYKQMTLQLSKPIKQLKISFQINGVIEKPATIKCMNQLYEGKIEIDQKQSIFFQSGSNPLQNVEALVNLSRKKFSLILNKQSPFMILNMDDNNTFVKLNEEKNPINQNNYQTYGVPSSFHPSLFNIIQTLTNQDVHRQYCINYSDILQNSYTILRLSNYPPNLEIVGIYYLLE